MPMAKRRPIYPAGIERSYARHLVAYARQITAEGKRMTPPIFESLPRHDADDGEDAAAASAAAAPSWFRLVQSRTEQLLADSVAKLRSMAGVVRDFRKQTDNWNNKEVHAQVRSALGVDVFDHEPWLADELATWEAENLRLIKSIPEQYVSQLRGQIVQAVRSGRTLADMKEIVMELGHSTEARAELIARDQIGKLNGDLTRLRQKGMGVTDYIWRGVMDRRERPAHVAREGLQFSWGKPPSDGHPGQPIRCRCCADAIFPDLDNITGHIIP